MVLEAATAATRHDAYVGTTLGDRFELLAYAGEGGMGRVYRARDLGTGAVVAVKLLPDDGHAARFAREAEILAAIDHPGIVRYRAHGTTPHGTAYLAMDWLSGKDLAERLEEETLSVDETLVVARSVADALKATHEHGIVHRDLKPANLFLVDGRLDAIKLIDFGIARPLADNGLTAPGAFVGTPGYMAPELVRGEATDVRVDVYGLGAILFCCLVGHAPFRGAHRLAVLAKVLLEAPATIRDLRPDVPPNLEALLGRMLAKEPEARPADLAEVALELRVIGDTGARSPGRVRATVSAREQRIACIVLCAQSMREDVTVAEGESQETEDAVRRAVEQQGGLIEPLTKGAWVITIPTAGSPTAGAARAVRCAMALSMIRPTAPLVVATGRMLVSGEHRVGEVIDRAVDALVTVSIRDGW